MNTMDGYSVTESGIVVVPWKDQVTSATKRRMKQ
jgi:hypothetical protein